MEPKLVDGSPSVHPVRGNPRKLYFAKHSTETLSTLVKARIVAVERIIRGRKT